MSVLAYIHRPIVMARGTAVIPRQAQLPNDHATFTTTPLCGCRGITALPGPCIGALVRALGSPSVLIIKSPSISHTQLPTGPPLSRLASQGRQHKIGLGPCTPSTRSSKKPSA